MAWGLDWRGARLQQLILFLCDLLLSHSFLHFDRWLHITEQRLALAGPCVPLRRGYALSSQHEAHLGLIYFILPSLSDVNLMSTGPYSRVL